MISLKAGEKGPAISCGGVALAGGYLRFPWCFVWSWSHHVVFRTFGSSQSPGRHELGHHERRLHRGRLPWTSRVLDAPNNRQVAVYWEWRGRGPFKGWCFFTTKTRIKSGNSKKVNKLCCACLIFDVLIHFSEHGCCILDSLRTPCRDKTTPFALNVCTCPLKNSV